MLSQEEIDALLNGGSKDEPELEFFEDELKDKTELLSEMEIDALGEIGNISMGTAATTLSTLLNKKVNITTPRVTITTAEELADEYKLPFVAVDVSYSAGLEGSNVLILKTDDVKIITDLMMGKDEVDSSRELTELDLSAAGEAMNQMMGSSSTSLSEMFMKKIDIAPPKSLEITFSDGKNEIDLLSSDSPLIKISFKMVIGDFIDSNIMQLIPLQFGKDMVDNLLNPTDVSKKIEEVTKTVEQPKEISEPQKMPTQPIENIQREPVVARTDNIDYNNTGSIEQEKVVVKKPEFQNFDMANTTIYNEQIDIVGDIPVEITVELGRTNKKINEILEFGPGTVVELDKLVGEALNIYANGKFIAKGEVVVIDDNFGIRVTEIEKNNTKII
jgi:flagellar motor switch protein FliN/FliY